MKKKLVIILAMIFISSMFAACVSGESGETKLKDWQDQVINVELGDRVDVDTSEAEGEDGQKYLVTFEVKTFAGEQVTVINSRFIADSLLGYKIIYTAHISENNSLSRTVTVKVKDSGKPVIKITGGITALEDESFTVPLVTVTDNSGEEISADLKLYKINGDSREEVNFEGTTIIFKTAGDYVFVATASDSAGNSAQREHEVSVVSKIYANAVQRFNAPKELEFFAAREGAASGKALPTGYSSEKRLGEQSSGAVYFDAAGAEWPNIFVDSLLTKQKFVSAMEESGAYISIWIYISTETSAAVNVYVGSGDTPWIGEFKVNQWQNVKITASKLAEAGFADSASFFDAFSTRAAALLWMYNPGGANMHVYVDSVYVAKDGQVNILMDNTNFELDKQIEIKVESSDIDRFVFEVTAGGETRYFDTNTFIPWAIDEYNVLVRSAYGKINASAEITLIVSGDYYIDFLPHSEYYDNAEGIAPVAQLKKTLDGSVVSDANISYILKSLTAEYEIIDGKFTLPYGRYMVYATSDYNDVIIKGKVSFAVEREAPKGGEIENFGDKYSDSSISKSNSVNRSWLKDYTDSDGVKAEGVIKLDFKNDWSSLYIKPRQAKTDYAGYDYLVIRLLILDPNNTVEYLHIAPDGAGSVQINNVVKNKWHNIYLPANIFLDNYDAFESGSAAGRIIIKSAQNGVQYSVYLDRVSLEKRTEVVDGEVEMFSDAGSIASIRNQGDIKAIDWLETYEGEYGVIKVHYDYSDLISGNGWPSLRFIPRQDKEDYQGFSKIRIRIYIEDADNILLWLRLTEIYSDGVPTIEGDALIKGEWFNIDIDAALFVENFDDFKSNAWSANGQLFGATTFGSSFSIYISAIYMVE